MLLADKESSLRAARAKAREKQKPPIEWLSISQKKNRRRLRQPTLADPAYLKIRDLIYRISGIYHADQKLYLLVSSCIRGVWRSAAPPALPTIWNISPFAPIGYDELHLLLNEITIGETYMFRHPAQLDALSTVVLPQIIQSKTAMGLKRLRIWSAGCSTGEEPYTLAMFLLEEKQLAGWTFDILATDLNSNSLLASKAGIYGEYALRNVTAAQRAKILQGCWQQQACRQ